MRVFKSERTAEYFASLRVAKPVPKGKGVELYDATYKDLIKQSKQTPKIVVRSKKQILTYYQHVDKDGIITFMTPSGTTPGKYWFQRVELTDLPALIEKWWPSKSATEIVRLAMLGDVKTQCQAPDGSDEPSWLYWGHKYKATVSKYNLGTPEKRRPDIRNPQLKGGGCKHVRAVMGALPFHTQVIARDLKLQGIFTTT